MDPRILDLFQELDHMLDADPVDMGRIERIFFELTEGLVDAILKQKLGGITAPYTEQFSRIAFEAQYLCVDNPNNGNLHRIWGRFEQVLDTINIADDTAVSEALIDTVLENKDYLTILLAIDSRTNKEVPIGNLVVYGNLDSRLKWMVSNGLIEATPYSVTFGPKGPGTLEAALEEKMVTPN